jgi:hypothetical protein
MSEASPTCVIIGPTQSGKTSLLGILQLATAKAAEQQGLALRMLPSSSDMVDLIEFSNSPENLGRLQSTLGVKRYVFDYEVTHQNRDRVFQKDFNARFSMIDAPGEALLGDTTAWTDPVMKKARAELVSELKTTNFIVLCADSTDSTSIIQFIRFLPRVLSETDLKRLPCEKLVICLTKADKYVDEHPNITTLDEFAYEDPKECADRVIGTDALNMLRWYLSEDAEIRVGWASVYGFDPETGRPNYEKDTGRLHVDVSTGATPAETLQRWQPYRIVEPFIFLTAGLAMNLKTIPPLGAHLKGIRRPKIFGSSSSRSRGSGSFSRKTWRLLEAFYSYIKF